MSWTPAATGWKVSIQTQVMGVPAQGAVTTDNVTFTVDADVYFRVIDPVKALVNLRDYPSAVSQIAQTSLRSVIGRADLDTLLSDRDHANAELKKVMAAPTEEPWGLRIERVEIKDIALPPSMMRSMSKQAEAARERHADVRHDGAGRPVLPTRWAPWWRPGECPSPPARPSPPPTPTPTSTGVPPSPVGPGTPREMGRRPARQAAAPRSKPRRPDERRVEGPKPDRPACFPGSGGGAGFGGTRQGARPGGGATRPTPRGVLDM